MIYNVVYTDTFGGEPNYCWVHRYNIYTDSNLDRELMRLAKKAAGLTGVRGRTRATGDSLEFRPYGMCTVLFVEPNTDDIEVEHDK